MVDTSAVGALAVVPPGGPSDVWHLVGGPGLLALAHASGRITLYSTVGGMVCLADRTAILAVEGVDLEALDVRFGIDSATWTFRHDGVRVERMLRSDPVSASLSLTWIVEGTRSLRIEDRWDLDALPLVPAPLMSRPVPVPSTHRGWARVVWRASFAASGGARALTDAVRRLVGRRHPLLASTDPEARRIRWAPRAVRRRPPSPRLSLAVPPTVEMTIGAPHPGAIVDVAGHGPVFRTGHGSESSFEVRATLRLVDPLLWERSGREDSRPSDPTNLRHLSDDPQIGREAVWHVQQLRALRVPDPAIERCFVMQGSAYAFVHGLHGAIRDEAFVVAALARPDPGTAREALLAMASMARPDGTFGYAHAGYGAVLSGGVHAAPTDLPLFYLWAVGEYLDATGDPSVLGEPVRSRGRSTRGRSRSVGDVAVLAARALDSHVGRGPHGLLRVGSGDWADPISLMVRRRGAFRRAGESAFNTGMALAVLPMAMPYLADLDPASARRCGELVDELDHAMEGAWSGGWYLRGWDGRGGPIGETHCFLDAQLWPIIAGHGPPERRAALIETVAARCDDPSPIGPTFLDRPHRVRFGLLADGWDCNGGVWAALGGLTAWAYALHDPERAEGLLRRMSFAGQADAYPDVWFGQWSGPDARNSAMGDRPGETFVHPATPMTEFPVMNSNAHAGPLLGLQKLAAASTMVDPR